MPTEELPPQPDALAPPVAPGDAPPDPAVRRRLRATRDRLIHAAATRLIHLGRDKPRLKRAGYWIYGTATHYWPRGRSVDKLGELGEGLYRGAQPSWRAFQSLQELGITTVINLRPECDRERRVVEGLGMRYLYMPLPPLDAPTHEVTLAFLSAVSDPANGRVFFHCFHGVDRTGTMAACVRIARDGWTVHEALEEMRAYRLHEQGQRAKVAYLAEFAIYWAGLDEAVRRAVLHQPLLAPPTAPASPLAAWWGKARGLVRRGIARLRGG